MVSQSLNHTPFSILLLRNYYSRWMGRRFLMIRPCQHISVRFWAVADCGKKKFLSHFLQDFFIFLYWFFRDIRKGNQYSPKYIDLTVGEGYFSFMRPAPVLQLKTGGKKTTVLVFVMFKPGLQGCLCLCLCLCLSCAVCGKTLWRTTNFSVHHTRSEHTNTTCFR